MVMIAASRGDNMRHLAVCTIYCATLMMVAMAIATTIVMLDMDMFKAGVYIAAMVRTMAHKHHRATRYHSRNIQHEQRKRHKKTKHLS